MLRDHMKIILSKVAFFVLCNELENVIDEFRFVFKSYVLIRNNHETTISGARLIN